MFQARVIGKVKTNILLSIKFQNCTVYEIHVEKSCRAGQATDDNVELAHFMLDD
jgi:hypothetical protein